MSTVSERADRLAKRIRAKIAAAALNQVPANPIIMQAANAAAANAGAANAGAANAGAVNAGAANAGAANAGAANANAGNQVANQGGGNLLPLTPPT